MITQDAFIRGENLIDTILQKMFNLNKRRRETVLEILMMFLSFRGRINFLQMSRQGSKTEKSYRNHFEKKFDWSTFNTSMVKEYCGEELILGFDPSYISKSGKYTPDIGYFYSGCAGSHKRGLEIGNLAVIDIAQNTAYHLEAIQTPKAVKGSLGEDRTLVDHYAEMIIKRSEELETISKVLAVDGYFAKKKFINPILEQTEMEIICKLRNDANLRYLYNQKQIKSPGRPKKFSGKIDTKNIDMRRIKMVDTNNERSIYEGIVYSINLKRKIKLCYVKFYNKYGQITSTKFLFSTNEERSALEIFKYYKARFQMEFIFRDAKQYTGLEHCQARSKNKLNFHFNASLTSINIAKGILRTGIKDNDAIPLSVGDLKIKLQNRNMLYRIFSIYGFDHKLIKLNEFYDKVIKHGTIAA